MSTTAAISETVSIKRGRPTVFAPSFMSVVGGLFPELRSKRQIVAKCYEVEAIDILQDTEGVDAIFNKTDTYHATILEQLGRLKLDGIVSDDEIQNAAVWLSNKLKCDNQFTTRQAVKLLRLLRDEVGARMIIGCVDHPADKLLQLLLTDCMEGSRDE